MASSTKQLLTEIETFLRAHDMRASLFGRDVLNDTSLVYRLRKGKSVRLETADRIRQFMADYRDPIANKGRKKRKNSQAGTL